VLTHSVLALASGQSQGIAPTKYQKNCGQVINKDDVPEKHQASHSDQA